MPPVVFVMFYIAFKAKQLITAVFVHTVRRSREQAG